MSSTGEIAYLRAEQIACAKARAELDQTVARLRGTLEYIQVQAIRGFKDRDIATLRVIEINARDALTYSKDMPMSIRLGVVWGNS
jgi:hypothetical protein